jgi:hypothetical protein
MIFGRKQKTEKTEKEQEKVKVDEKPKNYRYKCLQCGTKYGVWEDHEISLYRVVKPEFDLPPPKDTICPLCLKIGKITTKIHEIEEELDEKSLITAIKGLTAPQTKEYEELKSQQRALKEELVRLQRHLPGGESK